MSDDQTQYDGELFVTNPTEQSTDAESAASTEENNATEVKLEEPKVDAAELNRKKQVDVYVKRVMDGELDLENLPAKQKWLKPYIEKALDKQADAPVKGSTDVESIVEAKFQAKQIATELQQVKERATNLEGTSEQISEFNAEYVEFRRLGMNPLKAFEKARRLTGMSEGDQTQELRKAMALPKAGNYQGTREIDIKTLDTEDKLEAVKKLPEKERLAIYSKLKNSRY